MRLEKRRLYPEDKGRVVVAFLESFSRSYVEYDFTADLEDQLDRVSNNELGWRELLRDFWRRFHRRGRRDQGSADRRGARPRSTRCSAPHIFPAREDGGDPRLCPVCGNGRLSLKLGKFGAFIGCSNYPECRNTRPLGAANSDGAVENGAKELGIDPETGLQVTLRSGRFGPYRAARRSQRRARSPSAPACPRAPTPTTVDARACAQAAVAAARSRTPSGRRRADHRRHRPLRPLCAARQDLRQPGDRATTCSPSALNRAVTLIAEKVAKGPRERRFGADPGRALGDHPNGGGPVVAKSGPLRALCEPQRRQRHAAQRQDTGGRHTGRGGCSHRSARGQGRRISAAWWKPQGSRQERNRSSSGSTGREHGAQARRKAIDPSGAAQVSAEVRIQTGRGESEDAQGADRE